MLIKPFRFTPAFLRCYYLKKKKKLHWGLMWVKTRKTKTSFDSVRFSLCFSVCLSPSFLLCSALGRKSEEQKRSRLLFATRLLKRLYRAWQRGPACPSLIALFILCAVQGVSNALGLCVGRETTHHILSSVPHWGMGN